MRLLYITAIPDRPGLSVVRALREAGEALGKDMSFSYTNAVLGEILASPTPYLFGSGTDESVSVARDILAKEMVYTAVDLPPEDLEARPTPTPAPERKPASVTYKAAQMALVSMRMANGDPALALHHTVLLGHVNGEDPGSNEIFQQAAGFLLDTFSQQLAETIQETIDHYTGGTPEEGTS